MRRILVAAALTLQVSSLSGQSTPSLVGTWRLVSMISHDSTGRPQPYWDDQPIGQIVYTADGHMSAQLYDSRRSRLGVRWEFADPQAARASYVGLITYFGTYTVDTTAGTVTHIVEGAMAPDWIGGKLIRSFRFLETNRLELGVVTDATGQPAERASTLVWERVR